MKGSTKDICASHLSEDLARAENSNYILFYTRGLNQFWICGKIIPFCVG